MSETNDFFNNNDGKMDEFEILRQMSGKSGFEEYENDGEPSELNFD